MKTLISSTQKKRYAVPYAFKTSTIFILSLLLIICSISCTKAQNYLTADDNQIQYSGRIDFSDPLQPRYSFPGVSIKAKFSGTGVKAIIEDEGTDGPSTTNYYKIFLDNEIHLAQLKIQSGQKSYLLASGLTQGEHVVEIMKITEGASGTSSFIGFEILDGNQTALPLPEKPNKKIEFIGDSWTCGYGNLSQFSSGSASMANAGYLAINEDNYYAWGPLAARAIEAEYHVTAVSGRGLYRNNWDSDNTGNATGTLPKNYDNIIQDNPNPKYRHLWHPDVVCIHLGTNDLAAEGEVGQAAALDDQAFQDTYHEFLKKILDLHPCAQIIICYGNSKSDGYPSWTKQLSRLRTIAGNLISLFPNGNVTDLELPFTAESWPAQEEDCGYGDAWHPSICSHEKMSVALVAKLNSMTIQWGNTSACKNDDSDPMGLTKSNHQTSSLHVYPNPATNKICIKLQDDFPNNINEYTIENSSKDWTGTWTIVSQMGKALMTGSHKEIDISKLSAGMYCLIVGDSSHSNSITFLKAQ